MLFLLLSSFSWKQRPVRARALTQPYSYVEHLFRDGFGHRLPPGGVLLVVLRSFFLGLLKRPQLPPGDAADHDAGSRAKAQRPVASLFDPRDDAVRGSRESVSVHVVRWWKALATAARVPEIA